ncbi:hypothetical protein BDV06DRAFT_217707 [Aspergillus oleicola]
MAALQSNKWYQWYLHEVANGNLELPVYELNNENKIKLYYGEIFCRIAECLKSIHKYTATNNLRTHIASHEEFALPGGNVGGHASQKEIDAAARWYKGLFAGVKPSASSAAQAPTTPSHGGSVHITNMRKQAIELGGTVPCQSCSSRNDCCKDINKCDNFIFFNCGNMHPKPAAPGLSANTAIGDEDERTA